MTLATTPATAAVTPHPGVTAAAVADIDDVFASVRSTPDGLSTEQATQRRRTVGPNTVETHRARLWPVLIAQVRSPLLLLLVIAAAVSYVVGEHTDAIIIGVIVTLSVGLGVINEYRAARAADLLHDEVPWPPPTVTAGRPPRLPTAARSVLRRTVPAGRCVPRPDRGRQVGLLPGRGPATTPAATTSPARAPSEATGRLFRRPP
jgi:hypothetical protein